MINVLSVGQYAAALVAIAGLLAGAYRLFLKAVSSVVEPYFERLLTAHEESDEDHAQTVHDITGRLRAIEACLTEVRGQVFPNGGSSLRDRVDELYEMVASS